jgi:YfiH family protein
VISPQIRRRGGLAFWHLPAWEKQGVRACFFMRPGGQSQGAFRGLNVGLHTADLPANVAQNRQVALGAGGLGPGAPVLGQQVHGHNLRVAVMRDQGRGWWKAEDALPATDGILTVQPGLPVGVMTADCLPVLLAAFGSTRAVAAIHVGWRGLVAGILPEAIKKMVRYWQLCPEHIWAALGPAIGPRAFEVRGETLAQLRSLCPAAVRGTKPGALVAGYDLWQAAQGQLLQAGLLKKNLVAIRECTASHPRKYFSHRRDHGQTGRMLAMVQIKTE